MGPSTRRRSLTVSCIDSLRRKSPPSLPTPRPSLPTYQPPKFTLPPSSCDTSDVETRFNNLSHLHSESKIDEIINQFDTILSCSAPSSPSSLPLHLKKKFSQMDDFYESFHRSSSFILTGLESPKLPGSLTTTQEYFSPSADSKNDISHDLLDEELFVNDQRNFAKKFSFHYSFQDVKAVPVPFHLNPTDKLAFFSKNCNSENMLTEQHTENINSKDKEDDYEFTEIQEINSKSAKFSTSPILSYTLEKLKERSNGVYDNKEPPEFNLDVSIYDQ